MGDTQEETNVASIASDIAEDLDADASDVENSLRNLLDYSVPVDEAVRTVRRRYASSEPSSSGSGPRAVSELTVGDSGVSVEVLVLSAGKRSVNARGELTDIVEGELADSSGVISYTSWEEIDFEPGDEVRIEGAEVREWNGEPQLNLGASTRVSPAGDVEAVEGVRGEHDLAELEEGDRAVTVEAEVVEVEERTIRGRDGETRISSGTLGDSTGRLPFTDWENRGYEEGDAIRLENAYVNEFRGIPQVNMGEHTRVEPLEDVDVSHAPPESTIAETVEKGGDYDVVVSGNVLSVKDGSGIVERCPDCGRVVEKGRCRAHGEVDAEEDMRVKAVLDDGTGALNLIAGRELTEKIYGGSLEDAREEAREAMDRSAVEESIARECVGRRWRVRGNVSVGDYGANMNAVELTRVDDDPREAALEVLDGF